MATNLITDVLRAFGADRTAKVSRAREDFVNVNDEVKTKKASGDGLFSKVFQKMGVSSGGGVKHGSNPSVVRAFDQLGGKDIVADVMAAADPQSVQLASAKLHSIDGGTAVASNQSNAKAEAMKKLEGVLLANMLDSMVPKSESDLYGGGTAGDTWRSFQVNQMAEDMAQRGVLNLDQLGNGGASANNTSQWPQFQAKPITSYAS